MSQAVDNFGCLNNTIKVAAGHYVDLVNPDHETIEIRSIASALSKICRFGGHSPKFYSVAEHCIHATVMAGKDRVEYPALVAIFLHDAAEAYLGDMVKPLKVTMPEYMLAESRMERAIEEAFQFDFADYQDVIKKYDRAMLKAEKTSMWPEDSEKWAGFGDIPDRDVDFQFWSPSDAEYQFLHIAQELMLAS